MARLWLWMRTVTSGTLVLGCSEVCIVQIYGDLVAVVSDDGGICFFVSVMSSVMM